MTNQTYIISVRGIDRDPVAITTLVNRFITRGIAAGYINFDVKNIVTNSFYDGSAQKEIFYVAQINYYNPAIM